MLGAMCVACVENGFAGTQIGPVEFGGQFRTRYEVSDPVSFATLGEQTSQDMLLFRTRLWAISDIPDQKLRVFIQLQDSRVSGSEASVTVNSANVDLHQAYVDVLSLWGHTTELRVGRQELKYGDQRLISTLEWSNVGRAWDGARLKSVFGHMQVDLFYTIITEVADVFEDQKFSGLYTTCAGVTDHEFDVYVLSRHSGDATTTTGNGSALNLNQWTTGTRAKGKRGIIDYSGEAVYQFGKNTGKNINAHAYAVTGGVTLPSDLKPRIGAAYDFASGDGNPTDSNVNTFDPLFPFGHFYQGQADVFGWKNGGDLQGHFSIMPKKGTSVMMAYHHFTLDEKKDAWYNAGGAVLGQDTTGASGDDIGQEIDVHVKTKFRDVIDIWFGYARFIGGDFVKRNFPKKDKDFAFFQASINFN